MKNRNAMRNTFITHPSCVLNMVQLKRVRSRAYRKMIAICSHCHTTLLYNAIMYTIFTSIPIRKVNMNSCITNTSRPSYPCQYT